RVVALITDMDQPLGQTIGNALEVQECLAVLDGGGPEDLRELCLELSAWMLFLGERVPDLAAGRKVAQEMIASGQARDTFRRVVQQQGGDASVVDDPSLLPRARYTQIVRSKQS